MIFTCHTRRFVAETCPRRRDLSHRVSRPLLSNCFLTICNSCSADCLKTIIPRANNASIVEMYLKTTVEISQKTKHAYRYINYHGTVF